MGYRPRAFIAFPSNQQSMASVKCFIFSQLFGIILNVILVWLCKQNLRVINNRYRIPEMEIEVMEDK